MLGLIEERLKDLASARKSGGGLESGGRRRIRETVSPEIVAEENRLRDFGLEERTAEDATRCTHIPGPAI